MTDKAFSPLRIGGMTLKNRIIRSATNEGMADVNGRPTEKLIKTYRRLINGGVGCIVTGFAGVSPEGKSPFHNMLMLHTDDNISAFRRLTEDLKEESIPIVIQLAHCGRATRRSVTGFKPVAPSAVKDKMYADETPEELTEEGIERIIGNFIQAAVRAKKAGFDGIQIHLAHGYLLAQFLSANSNRRKDRWGGTIENRYRIVDRIITGIKEQLPNFPVWVKLNGYDRRRRGMRIDQAVQIAAMLEKSGCDAIEVSCGFPEDGGLSARSPVLPIEAALYYNRKFKSIPVIIKKIIALIAPLLLPKEKKLHAYNADAASRIKEHLSIPVIATGGIHSTADIAYCLCEKNLDGVSMSRPFILEPGLINKFKSGESTEAKCIKCSYCGVIQEDRPLRCYYGKLPGNEKGN